MKYIEEITFGEFFEFNGKIFILTQDYDNKNNHMCISIDSGQSRWLSGNTIVKNIELYRLDDENNIAPIKPKSKENI